MEQDELLQPLDAEEYNRESINHQMYCGNCGVKVIGAACDCDWDCYVPVFLPTT